MFLKWAVSVEAVPQNLYDKVMIPRVRPDERQREETLDADDAESVLEYLSRYEYASRVEGTRAVRVAVADRDPYRIRTLTRRRRRALRRGLRPTRPPRPETTLKNGKEIERPAALKPAVSEVLADHIQRHRKDVTDEHDRDPLFTTAHGRMHSNTIRRLAYRMTAPCYRGDDCPDCAEGESKCPEAVSPIV
ncbi:hypothetical protein [Halorubrum sp. DTA98]|uniref:hypothetical protein n=1 Tax=Halorubrum sp. DTA98 TaxID=3402163 RepID=UPI003AAC8401